MPVPQANASFGSAVASGDFDGNGQSEIAVGAPLEDDLAQNGGRVYLFDASSGALLQTLGSPFVLSGGNFGYDLAVADTDADGIDDLIVGSRGDHALVYAGLPMALRLDLVAPVLNTGSSFGSAVAGGDLTGDGRADIAVGAHNEFYGYTPSVGRVYLFDGNDGSSLGTLQLPVMEGGGNFGWDIAMGDTNGDDRADIVVGEEAMRAHYFDGLTLTLGKTFTDPLGTTGFFFGSSIAMGDLTGDGLADITIGASWTTMSGPQNEGRVYVYNGASLSDLYQVQSPTPSELGDFGFSLAISPATSHLAVGARRESAGSGLGRVHVFDSAGQIVDSLEGTSQPPFTRFGQAVAFVSLGSLEQLAVGVPSFFNDGDEAGYVDLLVDGAEGPTPGPIGGSVDLPTASVRGPTPHLPVVALALALSAAVLAAFSLTRRRPA